MRAPLRVAAKRRHPHGMLHVMTEQMNRYEVILYWSEPDRAILAEVPELPGCMADGKTCREALANVEVVIAEWIETARELGRPIPEPRGRLMFA
jgi:predicted RNase H-like HicB family nuclease